MAPLMIDIDEYSEYDFNISQINDTNDLILETDYIEEEEDISDAGTLLVLSVSLFTVASIVLSSFITRRSKDSVAATSNSIQSSKRGEILTNSLKKNHLG
ncbi:hypothetical protein HN011_004102 [Eciton burchellii]|nr:hypothetical protein HN011_004102 [Eciton burchellii]